MSNFETTFKNAVNEIDGIDQETKDALIDMGLSIIECEGNYLDGSTNSVKPNIKKVIEQWKIEKTSD